MQRNEKEHEPLVEAAHDAMPCCANVWDRTLRAYRSCDEWADPASDSDLCTKHQERLTALVSLITAAQSCASQREHPGRLQHKAAP